MKPSLLVLTVALVIATPSAARAQTAADTPVAVYLPGLGDLMTMTVQPRHIKLGLAGREKNWAYATYELAELNEALNRVAKLRPRWRDFAIAEMMRAVTKEPLGELADAIKSADGVRFAQSHGKLTESCNLCHQSTGQGVIVIKVPETSPYPDQNFQPARK
ncbi:MAG: cytochrome family protein [Acetobacteraceae bacterium]|nr:cytochrome family protein [Acetobacteraceae bacterium]